LDAKTAVIAAATGYIGKSTVSESIRQGYQTFALVIDAKKVTSKQGKKSYAEFFDGVAGIIECDVTDEESVKQALQDTVETKADEGKNEAVVTNQILPSPRTRTIPK
jgi:divinyl chlorophyllide a 8-vinyl-reductase